MKNIYLMFGGESPEHEISLITAKQVFKNIDKDKYKVYPIYLDKKNVFKYVKNFEIFQTFKDFKNLKTKDIEIVIKKGKVSFKFLPFPDCIFLSFHGGIGESGQIQGFLDMLDVAYTGPSLKGAVYGMDKVTMKQIFEANNLDILPWIYIDKKEWKENKEGCIRKAEALSYPLIVKPSQLGSSIGVSKVNNQRDLIEMIEQDFLFDSTVIVEKFGENLIELNCSVRRENNDIIASLVEEVQKSENIFSYDEKYVKGGKKKSNEGMASAKRNIPANISEELTAKVQETAKKVFEVLHGESLARVDFLANSQNNKLYIIEINTIPGSLSYYFWEAEGIQYFELIDSLIDEAITVYEENKKIVKSFDSPLWES